MGEVCDGSEKVGRAVGSGNPAAAPAVNKECMQNYRRGRTDEHGTDTCWEHTYAGYCPFGDKKCRYSHAEAAGSRRLEVADEAGFCLNFKEHGSCKRLDRGKCPFKHGATDDAPMSSEEHQAVVKYAEAKGKDPCEVKLSTVVADGGVAKWAKYTTNPEPSMRKPKVFPIMKNKNWGRRRDNVSYKEALI